MDWKMSVSFMLLRIMKIIKANENRRAFSALEVAAKPTAILFKTSTVRTVIEQFR